MKIVAANPSYKRTALLERCLRTLREQGVTEHYVATGITPTFAARNAAIAQCPGDSHTLILWADDDCWYDHELNIQETADRYRVGETGVVQITRIMPGKTKRAARGLQQKALCWTGGGMLFHKSVWEAVGGVPDDYLDDVMFSASAYRLGYQNYRSTLSYGHHDVDTPTGGMAEAIRERRWATCHPERYGVDGEPCQSKHAIPNIRSIRATDALRREHCENRAILARSGGG